jgi:transcriptional regulator
MLCAIHSTTIENTLFKKGDGAKLQIHFCTFNLTQVFLHLQKKKKYY